MQLGPPQLGAINALALTANPQLLLSASTDGSIRIWDLHKVCVASAPLLGCDLCAVQALLFEPCCPASHKTSSN